MPGPTKDVKKRLTEEELDEAIDEAQSNNESRLVRRLCLIKNLYAGDSVTEAATRVGVTQPTASRWTDRWNEHGVDGLRPYFGGGRPLKLTEEERAELADVLKRHRPLTTEHVQRLIEDGFDVSYSQRHILRLLDDLDIRHTVLRADSSDRPDDTEERLEHRFEAALNGIDDDITTDGGAVVFLDGASPDRR